MTENESFLFLSDTTQQQERFIILFNFLKLSKEWSSKEVKKKSVENCVDN